MKRAHGKNRGGVAENEEQRKTGYTRNGGRKGRHERAQLYRAASSGERYLFPL